MSIRRAIPSAMLMLLAPVVQAERQPITFARGGKTVSTRVANDDRPVQSVVLSAYGRVWTKPAPVKNQTAHIEAPVVRVPTVFSITPTKNAKRTLGEVVVYPDGNVAWGTDIILYAAGTPKWFDQWALATGLPVAPFPGPGFRRTYQLLGNVREILVIGGEFAGKKFADAIMLAREHEMNILVLDADWFGGKSGKVAIGPEHMACELAAIRKQKWPKPMMFSSARSPWAGVVNRRAWIASKDGQPLVEEIVNMAWGWKGVVSYLPWAEQLGRCEAADKTLRSVLSAVAEPAKKLSPRILDILHPSQKVLGETSKQRPVLTAGSQARGSIKDIPSRVHVIDLRGGKSPPTEFAKTLKRLASRDGKSAPLIILGDDPLLDNWKWAKIDRKKRISKQTGVVWMPDDTLPPSTKTQIRLMLKLTKLGIPLEPLKTGEKE